MTNVLKLTGAALAFAFVGFGANAATYTPDTLLGSALQCTGGQTVGVDCDFQGSSTGAEIGHLEGILGLTAGSLLLDDKFEESTLAFSQDDGGNWFVDVDPDEPGFFILKFGVGQTGADTHYFFRNVAELTKLVWTSAQVAPLMDNCRVSQPGEILGEGDCRLSHVTTVVPLPAAGWLMFAAIGGLAALRRKTKA